MPNVQITLGAGLTDRIVGLATREIRPDGIDLDLVIEDSPRKIFDRMAGTNPFDASEMSFSEFVMRVDANDRSMAAIPAFTSRMFRHSYIVVNRKAIAKPADLRGKRIGIPIYTTTAAVYMRALLQHEYDVDLEDVEWLTGDLEKAGGHAPVGTPLRKPVRIERNVSEKSLGQLLAENAIQAIISPTLPSVLGKDPDVVRLFPDYVEVEAAYYARTGIFPIMHLVTIRRAVCEQHPFVAESLYKALCASKDLALKRMHLSGSTPYMLPWMSRDLQELADVLGPDPWPYGVEKSRLTLEAFTTYLFEQGMTSRVVPIDELFIKPGEGMGT
jgi:4,5-dihydroxyphthalate decarboxylase